MRQTTLYGPQGELDTVDIDPLADVFEHKLSVTAAAVSPNVRGGSGVFKYGTNLNEERDVGSSDDGSIVDCERNTWVDCVIRHFGMDLVHFLWMWMVRTRWLCFLTNCFPDEVWADIFVSVHEEVTVLAFKDDLISQDERTDEVSWIFLANV